MSYKNTEEFFHNTEELWKFWRKTDLWFEKRLEKFGKFSPEHLKVSKLELWWDPFAQSRKCMTLTFTRGIDMRNFTNFDPSTPKSKKFVLIGSLWPKYILFELQKYWGVMQILKKDWPVVWKKTWEIWQIFTRVLESVKIGTLMGSFCPK